MAEYLDRYREAIQRGDDALQHKLRNLYGITKEEDSKLRNEVMADVTKNLVILGDFITVEDLHDFLEEGDELDN